MTSEKSSPDISALRIQIGGIVQGVGFRPFVYRCAQDHHLTGWVLNGTNGVQIHAEGKSSSLELFMEQLRNHPPAHARLANFEFKSIQPKGYRQFQIRNSDDGDAPSAGISPDLTICPDCTRELFDPADRRAGYPYINCTNCGPRYTIVRKIPYDRCNTTMADWPLCELCRKEYEDPANRRYHAQPTACPRCGPNYSLVQGGITLGRESAAIQESAQLLRQGKILAIKGIGGYHLACDPYNQKSVEELRSRKFRKEKPFALMVNSVEEARQLVYLSADHERLLLDPARPIVLAPSRKQIPGIAPDNLDLGIMLPYAPLHLLLFKEGAPSPLVLTSGNRSSEPIAYEDDQALELLSGIADAFLIGDRPIARRVDDSLAGLRQGKPFILRRSRGYAPSCIASWDSDKTILAVGADLKNSIALLVRGQVVLSQYIGDLGDLSTNRSFEETIADLLSIYHIDPKELIVAHDLHPQYFSTRKAEQLPCAARIGIQHHQAHVAAVMAEQGLLDQPFVGVALDGTGFGLDDTIWGFEIFVGSVRGGLQRVAHLLPVAMPGGDAAARHPVQAAAGFLSTLENLPDLSSPPFSFPRRFFEAHQLIQKNIRCFKSTSAGRLFDTVSALLGFTREISFEGQAAMWLEMLARQSPPQQAYPFPNLDFRPLLQEILHDRQKGRPIEDIAQAFHASLAEGIVQQVLKACSTHNVDHIALSGGVFQNEILLDLVIRKLQADERGNKLKIFWNELVPANDGGIALGQIALALFQR